MIGLTRGFMYAGAARIVNSLWKVEDSATAELMKIFYTCILKKEMSPAAALRQAKIEMMQKHRWESPYYWSAFMLHGEWQTL
jgi:CHAT domain-containing protein